ncbi:CAP domain-containing protein [Halobacillus sp. BBL2006]|uniref:CAP domain-containing protein n=1 Tax=Halobacillus sp. BBL2006 TaxID=1543706 RepID=UPI0009DD26D2|nr:CAP domain-containing protein [Halobacillus sp. BBL2006]
MLKRILFTVIAVVAIGFLFTTELNQYLLKPKAAIEKVTNPVQNWLEENDIDNSSPLLESMKDFFKSGEMPAPSFEQEESAPAAPAIGNGKSHTESLDKQSTSVYERTVVELVNEERDKQGLPPLKMDERLSDLARKKSQDMADKQYFSHISPTYGSPFDMMKQFDFKYRAAGENIAAGQRTPEEVVEGWMNSEGHRANILNDSFTQIGVGYVEDSGPYGTYWTQMFMKPL